MSLLLYRGKIGKIDLMVDSPQLYILKISYLEKVKKCVRHAFAKNNEFVTAKKSLVSLLQKKQEVKTEMVSICIVKSIISKNYFISDQGFVFLENTHKKLKICHMG